MQKANGVSLNKAKCKIFKTEIKILGFIVGSGIVKIDPDKVKAIREFKKPTTILPGDGQLL